MLLHAFAILGLLTLLLGVVASVYLWRRRGRNNHSLAWRVARALAIGLSLGLPPLSLFVSYPYRTAQGLCRVEGFPFLNFYFDAQGFYYVGAFTPFSTVGNALAWCAVPWIALAGYARFGRIGSSGA